MKFCLIDAILECEADPPAGQPRRIVAVKQVSAAEEYLADHFPTFPVLPGVLMIEAMVQAARELASRVDPVHARAVLGEARSFKYSGLVRPGDRLVVEITMQSDDLDFRGKGAVHRPDGGEPESAVSGRFRLRPPNVG